MEPEAHELPISRHLLLWSYATESTQITEIVAAASWRLKEAAEIAVMIRRRQAADVVFMDSCDKLVAFAVDAGLRDTVLQVLWASRTS